MYYYYLLFTRLLHACEPKKNVFDIVFRRVARLIEPVCVAKSNVPARSRDRQHYNIMYTLLLISDRVATSTATHKVIIMSVRKRNISFINL